MPNDLCVMIVVHILKDGNVMVQQYTCLANINLFHSYSVLTT
jgi:hypothetical protein